ncbi:MAG: signal transduction protein [Deltaproteobacteria bacterium HGW-Deltaproteobacteria-12]|jgi:CBS domain-containing protein|nr:MAG: signal transduction protein [Deltaproteobacteria bacterium HGW-Deltaproteobacteria-12]
MNNEAYPFLQNLPPFSFLPDLEVEKIAAEIVTVNHPKDVFLLLQGQTKVEHLHILKKGAVERYYRERNKDLMRALLHKGDFFGGISMLLHDSISVCMFRTTEDSELYLLPKRIFLDLCARYPVFSDFFTDMLGKWMLDKSYAMPIAKTIQPKEELPQIFNQSVENIFSRKLVFCDTGTSIQDAAAMMGSNRCSSILVREPQGDFTGIMTDRDLRTKVIIQAACDMTGTVSQIMSSPLSTVPAAAPVSDALMIMMIKNIKHLPVTDADEKVIGIVTNKDILEAHRQSPFFLLREIHAAASLEEIADKQSRLPKLIQSLISSGAKAMNVTRMVSVISDAILNRLIGMAIAELGPPPVRFTFLIVGSEGRREQTLKTDQDNAIVYEDPPEAEETVRAYFLRLAEKVCNWLDQAGYAFCQGGVMAKNPQWCQPLSVWKKYFSTWIGTAEPEALLQSSIFFDFRGGYGDRAIVDELRKFLFQRLAEHPNFFRYLAETTLERKPPLGFFRAFVVESKGKHRDTLDVKHPMITIVNYTRLYALQNGIEETNTQERMYQLFLKKRLSWDDYNDFEQAYSFLMHLRLARQLTALIRENAKPDNYINPNKLSRLEQTMLKEVFKRIETYQEKMVFDFWK